MIKNRIFSFVLCSMLASAVYADRTCTERHIWFGPQCMGQGGQLNCNGWRVSKGGFTDVEISSNGYIQNGATINYCHNSGHGSFLGAAMFPDNITIVDPHGDSRSFYIGGWSGGSDGHYIAHNDIRNTGSISLNTPANGDITINGDSWGSLTCDSGAIGENCHK